MSEEQSNVGGPQVTLGRSILLYGAALLALGLLMFVSLALIIRFGRIGQNLGFGAAFIGYFALGFWLNRTVLRALIDWHPLHDTLEARADTKGKMMILWPFKYPALFLKLAASKYL